MEQRRKEAEAIRRFLREQAQENMRARVAQECRADTEAKALWTSESEAARFPLHLSCQFGSPDDVQHLLDAGYDIYSRNENGESVLDLLLDFIGLRRGIRGSSFRSCSTLEKKLITDLLLRHHESRLPQHQSLWRDALENADLKTMQRLHSEYTGQLELNALVTSRAYSLYHQRLDALTLLCVQHHTERNKKDTKGACLWFLRILGSQLSEESIRSAFNLARHMGHTFLIGKLLQSHWSSLCSGPEDSFLQAQLESAAHYGHDGQCGLIIDESRRRGYPIQPHRALKDAVACSQSGNPCKSEHALRVGKRLIACDIARAFEAIHSPEDWNCLSPQRMLTPLERARQNLEGSTEPSRGNFQSIVTMFEQLRA